MEPDLFKTLGQIAGVGGVALGVFLLLFREVIRKRIFPKFTKQQGYRIVLVFMVLTWTVAIAGLVTWGLLTRRQGTKSEDGTGVLTVQLWNVELDTKGSLVNSHEITFPRSDGVPSLVLDSTVAWLTQTLGISRTPRTDSVHLIVRIPADSSGGAPVMQREPPGPLEVRAWHVAGGGKNRIPLDVATLALLDGPFTVEVSLPGYGSLIHEMRRGVVLDTTLVGGGRRPLRLGLEAFGGESGVTEQLASRLALHPALIVVNPELLASLREEFRARQEELARKPMVQMDLRVPFGVDYILSGSLAAHR